MAYENNNSYKELSASELDDIAGGRGNGAKNSQKSRALKTQKSFSLSKFFQRLFCGSKIPDSQRQKDA